MTKRCVQPISGVGFAWSTVAGGSGRHARTLGRPTGIIIDARRKITNDALA
jgi:ribosomal protein L13E